MFKTQQTGVCVCDTSGGTRVTSNTKNRDLCSLMEGHTVCNFLSVWVQAGGRALNRKYNCFHIVLNT